MAEILRAGTSETAAAAAAAVVVVVVVVVVVEVSTALGQILLHYLSTGTSSGLAS